MIDVLSWFSTCVQSLNFLFVFLKLCFRLCRCVTVYHTKTNIYNSTYIYILYTQCLLFMRPVFLSRIIHEWFKSFEWSKKHLIFCWKFTKVQIVDNVNNHLAHSLFFVSCKNFSSCVKSNKNHFQFDMILCQEIKKVNEELSLALICS